MVRGPKYIIFSFLFALCVNYASCIDSGDQVIICYYGSWAVYKPGYGNVSVPNIDPFICTHIIYAFVGVLPNGTVYSLDNYVDYDDGLDGLDQINYLKLVNPNLKTLLSVGGSNAGSANFSTMAGNSTYRNTFIQTAVQFMQAYEFDGFDIDWEYPARRDSVNGSADIENFSTLLKEMREIFDPQEYLLTAAVSSVESAASLSYNISKISKYLDFINIMTFDMHVTTENVTGYNSPLHAGDKDDVDSSDTVEAAIKYWLDQGAPAYKLILGIPFYGHTFNLTYANQTTVGSPNSGPGIAGPYTTTAGTIGYNEFCVMLQNGTLGWKVYNDTKAKVPYSVQGNNWVSFDNVWSITEKVKFAVEQNLGGVMTWSIETDDVFGQCGESWPLLKAINNAIRRDYEALSSDSI